MEPGNVEPGNVEPGNLEPGNEAKGKTYEKITIPLLPTSVI